MNKTLNHVIEALLGTPGQANAAIAQARSRLRAEIASLDQRKAVAMKSLEALDSLDLGEVAAAGATQVSSAGSAPVVKRTRVRGTKSAKPARNGGPSSKMTPQQRAARRDKVIAALRKGLSKSALAKLTPAIAAAAVKKSGLNLGVEDSALPITVGNILYHSKKTFKPVEKGVYRYIGK